MPKQTVKDALHANSAFINRCVLQTKTSYHAHDFVEIAYVASGEGTHHIKGERFEVKKGDIFLINYDVAHEFVPKSGELLVYNCIFTPAYFNAALAGSRNFFDVTDHFLLSNLYTNLQGDYIFATAEGGENSHVLAIYERMLQEFKKKQIGYRDIMRGYVIELLVIICRLRLSVTSDRTQKILGVLDHINAHYRECLEAKELAKMAGFSEPHFRRVFKDLTGKTVSLYQQTLRVEEACRLLRERTQNVEEIATAVGYSDMKHFYTVFKRITGKLPSSFR